MRSFVRRSSPSLRPRLVSAMLASIALGLSLLGSTACAEDEQPLTSALGATPAGGGSGGSAGATGLGGSAGAQSTSSGGRGGQGGTGGAGGGGGGAAGEGGKPGHVTCKTENPAGCSLFGCAAGETCVQLADVCVPSDCACGDTGLWSCSEDCGGGTCVAANEGDGSHFVRLALQVGQQGIQELCVAYGFDAAGNPAFAPNGLLAPFFLSAADLSKPGGPLTFDKISRYLPLAGAPSAFGLSSSLSCADIVASVPVVGGGNYFTVFSMPYSGEAPETWLLRDHGLDAAPPEPPAIRVVNALLESKPVTARLVDGDGALELGTLPFGNSPAYVPLPVGGPVVSPLHGLSVRLENGTEAAVDFLGMDLLTVGRHTIFLRGSEEKLEAVLCNDARADEAFFGGPPSDARFSGCLSVPATYAD